MSDETIRNFIEDYTKQSNSELYKLNEAVKTTLEAFRQFAGENERTAKAFESMQGVAKDINKDINSKFLKAMTEYVNRA